MPKRDIRLFLLDMLEAIEKIERYIVGLTFEGFEYNEMVVDAVVRNLEIIGEAVGKISSEIKTKYSDVLWQPIKDFRNKIVNEYFGIDYRMVWDIVKNELPILNSQISDIIKDLT